MCGLLEVLLSFLPPRAIQKAFPPLITGPVVFLIGASLIGDSGFLNWGGGANGCQDRPATGLFALCPTIDSPHALLWGSREFLGLGLASFMTIVIVEIFGSASMRSASIVIGLIFPTLVLGIPLHYTSRESIDSAKAITFLWVSILFYSCLFLVLTTSSQGTYLQAQCLWPRCLTFAGSIFEPHVRGHW